MEAAALDSMAATVSGEVPVPVRVDVRRGAGCVVVHQLRVDDAGRQDGQSSACCGHVIRP
ncbi:hypothetical protein [Streptomyces sp. NPDC048644]|uniref:hypothetical protein n=1 Tax=Streptomyces sp. NPDC048644 TaxID=3365582 RepID=UPI00371517B3